MIVILAASLAALGSSASVGLIASLRNPDLLASDVIGLPRTTERSGGLERIGRWPFVRSIKLSRSTSERLTLLGGRWNERGVVGAKAIAGAAASMVGMMVGGPILTAPLALLAWRIPDLFISRLARRTIEGADREIPVLLDLLAVATSAGLPPQLAFRLAVQGIEGPLAEALGSVINATDLGARWRDELVTVGDRLDLPDLRRLLRSLTRTEALGSSLSEEVARLASDVREVRRAAAAQRARTAPVKMLFPLVFLVLPAFLLLTVVPVLLTTVRSIG